MDCNRALVRFHVGATGHDTACRLANACGCRYFACNAVRGRAVIGRRAQAGREKGRANFTDALDDPRDQSHIISFSGENGQRTQDNLYELAIDRMLLNSKDRPKVDGLPTPTVELSNGVCRQIGNFAARYVSSVWCSATDDNGKTYELRFESDGSPITLRRVRLSAPTIRQDPYR